MGTRSTPLIFSPITPYKGGLRALLFLALISLTAAACTPGLIGVGGRDALYILLHTPLAGLSYTYGSGAYVRNMAVPSNTPILAVGAASSYAISPALPTGMAFDTTTGIISGTPSADTALASTPAFSDFTVTATNAVSTTSVTLKLLVMQGFYVNQTSYTVDASVGNGVCSTGTATGGPCSLRAAVQEANSTGTKTLIYITEGTYTLTAAQSLGGGTLTNVILCGASPTGVVVSASGNIRSFTITSSTLSATFCNMTIQNGNDTGGTGGGAILITNAATTQSYEFRYMRFLNNASSSYAGAIELDSSTSTPMVIDHSYFEGNSAAGSSQGGGAVLHNQGTLNVTQSTFKSNTAPNGTAGAIFLFNTGTLNCDGCLFQSNTGSSTLDGGAISVANTSNLNVKNSTFYANQAGGGAALDFAGTGTGNVSFSTFSNNVSLVAANHGGAILVSNASAITTTANIFQNNTSGGSGEHCYRNAGTWTSGGYNVFSSAGGTCATSAGPGDTSVANTNIASTLAYNNGETQNFSIGTSSAAYNLVPLATCASTTTDVRLFARPSGSLCDAGAFEYTP